MKARFLDGIFGSTTEGALWTIESSTAGARSKRCPTCSALSLRWTRAAPVTRTTQGNDEIGICVAGLGVDGYATSSRT
jgi:hypothetical protein